MTRGSNLKNVIVSLNAMGFRDRSMAACLLRDLMSIGVDVTAIQERHFLREVHGRVLSNDYVDYSACGDLIARCVSLLVKPNLDASVVLVQVG